MTTPMGNGVRSHNWNYYLLGGNKQQLAVYNGRETSKSDCYSSGQRVYFYPSEYLTYGFGSSALLTTRADGYQEYKIVDHLGSTRSIVDSTGYILSSYDYEPFGAVLAQTGADSRKSYIDKEKDKESGLGNFGVRSYDDNEGGGRFTSIDPMWEDYRAWSPYQYGLNNPIRLLDPSGMAAWEISNEWNKDYIDKYRSFVASQAESYQRSGIKATCEDFSLRMIIDFASKNNLPVTFTNSSGTYDAASNDFNNIGEFLSKVLSTTGASDLQKSENTQTTNLSAAKTDDLILIRSDAGIAHHVQVITSNSELGTKIHQGNSNFLNGIPGASRMLNSSNPSSWFYAGKSIESGIIDCSGNYSNLTTSKFTFNFLQANNVEVRQWNFGGWKK